MKESSRFRILINLSWRLLRLWLSGDENKQQLANKMLFDTFQGLGGIYVKFLQILALDPGFLRGWAGPAEFDIFEAVSFEEIDLPGLLQSDLPDYEKHFSSIDLEPFAAGSFAQVYRGELRDGTKVVLKILRPSLVKNLKSDLKLLKRVTRVTRLLYKTSVIDVGEAYRQFSKTVQFETDYRREVKNAIWFYNYFSRSTEVVIPKTYEELSGNRIIVQEMLSGVSLAEVLQSRGLGQNADEYVYDKVGSNLWTQMETFGTELLLGILTADFVIGDPHPGNIKLLPENKLGLIDFGIAASAPANRQAFLNLLKEIEKMYAGNFDAGTFTVAALQFFDEELTQSLTVAGQILSPWEPHALIRKIAEAARRVFDDEKNSAQVETLIDQKMVMRLFNQSINEKNRFGLSINLDAVDMLKSATTCIKVIRAVGEEEQIFPIIHRGMQRAISLAENGNLPASDTAPDPRPEYALEFLSSWLAGIADSDPFLYRQITGSIST